MTALPVGPMVSGRAVSASKVVKAKKTKKESAPKANTTANVSAPNFTGGATLPGSGASIGNIIKSFQAQQDAANASNEKRYSGILGLLSNQGNSSKLDVSRAAKEDRASGTQSLIDRGLFNSTVLDSMNRRSRESEGRQKAAIDESVAMNKAGVMERRTDAGPDAGMLAQLLQAAAQGAGQQAGQASGPRANNFAGIGGGGGRGGGSSSGMAGGGGGGSSGGSGVQTFTNSGGGGGGGLFSGGVPIQYGMNTGGYGLGGAVLGQRAMGNVDRVLGSNQSVTSPAARSNPGVASYTGGTTLTGNAAAAYGADRVSLPPPGMGAGAQMFFGNGGAVSGGGGTASTLAAPAAAGGGSGAAPAWQPGQPVPPGYEIASSVFMPGKQFLRKIQDSSSSWFR